ncbi:hypothetical protein HF576_01890 [Microbacterium sp. CFH 90308]|uniref:Uncharacterized protein n=1 Tax=Microbacterium salsuginis TaxID=2722803 RepID=A0ABX1K8Z8_9MICO|nr:hypothetical protein [Microbacterium sp. CFH 90308]NLP82590.1 hypothetical protein [Microbacterium sp. CFH 90308]
MRMHLPILTTTEKATQEGIRDWNKATLKRARELSPTDTGDSDKSGFSVVDDLTGQVGFTSLVSKLQHENLDYVHAGGGQAKFLETAVDETDPEPFIAARIRKAFGG